MTSFVPVGGQRGPSWLLEVLDESPAARRVHRWWQWAVLSIGCVSGCATSDQVAHNLAQPFRATGDLMARTSDRVGDLFERDSTRTRNPANLPAYQAPQSGSVSQTSPATKTSLRPATAQAGATAPAISQPAATQAIHNTPAKTEVPRELHSVPQAPPAVELLPAPPATPTSAAAPAKKTNPSAPATASASPLAALTISSSRPIPATPATAPAVNMANATWCRVRIRNVSQQPVTQVSVTVMSPENAPLVSKEGDKVSPPTAGKMEFAPVAQVGANEEVILVIGVASANERGNRLRVQVRDALGGTNQDVQARWQVAIEAAE